MLIFNHIRRIIIILTILAFGSTTARDIAEKNTALKTFTSASTALLPDTMDVDEDSIGLLARLFYSDSVTYGSNEELHSNAGLELHQNYPNPFNLSTTIEYTVPDESEVYLAVYNIFGKRVKIIQDELVSPGNYEVSWDGRDDSGDSLASGMYFYLFSSDGNFIIRKMILLK